MEKKGVPVLQLISLLISCVILFTGVALTANIEFQGKCLYRGPWAKSATGTCALNNNLSGVKGEQTAEVNGSSTSLLPGFVSYEGKFSNDFELQYDPANMVIAEAQDQLYIIPQNNDATEEQIIIKQSPNGIVEVNQEDCETYIFYSARYPNSILGKTVIVASANGNVCKLYLTENSEIEDYQYLLFVYLFQDTTNNRTWELTKIVLSTTAPELDRSLDQIIDSFMLK